MDLALGEPIQDGINTCETPPQVESQGDLQCRPDSEHQGEPTQPQDPQVRAQAVVQQSDPCLTGARRTDLCVGGQI